VYKIWKLLHGNKKSVQVRKLFVTFRKVHFFTTKRYYPTPNCQPDSHFLWTVSDFLFSTFAATLYIWRPSPPSATRGCAMRLSYATIPAVNLDVYSKGIQFECGPVFPWFSSFPS